MRPFFIEFTAPYGNLPIHVVLQHITAIFVDSDEDIHICLSGGAELLVKEELHQVWNLINLAIRKQAMENES